MKPTMLQLDLQNDDQLKEVPAESLFIQWVEAALQQSGSNLEQTIRVVSVEESRQLNKTYRGKDHATNVLSFPAEGSDYLDYQHLGDLVICSDVVTAEAREQGKAIESHWAHMVVHGMLHLQGFDHIDAVDADKMESLEIEILQRLGHTNPYL